jgi:tetratricopeptide (TPR) repeat protein
VTPAAIAGVNRGNAYYRKRDYDRAIADYTKAIELDPNYANAYTNRGKRPHLHGKSLRAITLSLLALLRSRRRALNPRL